MTFELRLRNMVQPVESTLKKSMQTEVLANAGVPPRLSAAMCHAVFGSGKRIRPFLVMASAELFEVPLATAAEVAAAVELVHCYSLVHDDLPAMDNDEMRRGQPSVWSAFDEHTAILAGDALLTLSFEWLARPSLQIAPLPRAELIAALARAAGPGGMVGGQQLDLDASRGLHAEAGGLEFIERMESMKTGAMIELSAEAGAILAGVDPTMRCALRSYGRALGLAFQIADDLLDLEGDAATLGKAVGKDVGANKATLIAAIGSDAARQRLNQLRDEAHSSLRIFGSSADLLREAANYVASRRN